jgi:cytochrome c peroxidase
MRAAGILVSLIASVCAGCGGGSHGETGGAGASTGSGGSVGTQPPPIAEANHPPIVVGSENIEVRAIELHPFSYDLAKSGHVVDPDGDPLHYKLTPNRDWVTIDGAEIRGTPPNVDQVYVRYSVDDGEAGVDGYVIINVAQNAIPQPVGPGDPILVGAGTQVDYDATENGGAFVDADGDVLSYELALLSPPRGLEISGTYVVGSIASAVAVNFRLTARDAYGGENSAILSFAVEGPDASEPTLPSPSYVYQDEALPLPLDFKLSSEMVTPFWDTQPGDNRTSDAGATLGRVLFYDKRLSITNTHACASCHQQAHGFASTERFNTGVAGIPLKRNAMGLTNVRYNFRDLYFADERAKTLEMLALMPIVNRDELGNALPMLEAKLAATSFYPPLFEAAFGSPEVTSDRIARALAQFLRALISYQSRFDEAKAASSAGPWTAAEGILTPLEIRGAELFHGGTVPSCQTCHALDVQILTRPRNTGLDAVVTDAGVEDGKFRTASLRNIGLTAPYMHDGRFATLREVIDHYDHGVQFSDELDFAFRGLGDTVLQMNLSDDDKQALEAFLLTLTDDTLVSDPRFSDPFR